MTVSSPENSASRTTRALPAYSVCPVCRMAPGTGLSFLTTERVHGCVAQIPSGTFCLETFALTCSFLPDRSPYPIPLPTLPLAAACALCWLPARTPLPLEACPARLTKPGPSIQTLPCPSRALRTLARRALGALLPRRHGSSQRAGFLPVCLVHPLSHRTAPGAQRGLSGALFTL